MSGAEHPEKKKGRRRSSGGLQPRVCSRSQSLSRVTGKTPPLQTGPWAPAPKGTGLQAPATATVWPQASCGTPVTSRGSRPAAATLEVLRLWRPGVATAHTPQGLMRLKGWRRIPAPFGVARFQRPPTSGLHRDMAVSSAG